MSSTDEKRAPLVGLYGSVSTPWRAPLIEALERAGVACFDPVTREWQGINDGNGDEMQPRIDALVAREFNALREVTCVVFHLDGASDSLASRMEFGWLLAAKVPTFFAIDARVKGRNHIFAAAKLYEHMHRSESADEALQRALAWMRESAKSQ